MSEVSEPFKAGEEQQESGSQVIVFIIMGIFLLLLIISYIIARFISINDFYSLTSLITAFLYILDTITDILFVVNISKQSDYPSSTLSPLLLAAIFFIILPVTITIFQLFLYIKKWKRNYEVAHWLDRNIALLYILSVITGSSFSAVLICTSSLFNLNKFSLPLDKLNINKYQIKRVYSIVLLQNLPQIAIQLLFLAHVQNSIVYISMTFSILSMLISIASVIAKRNLLTTTTYVSIEFDITGLSDVSKHRNKVSSIKHKIATILGIDSHLFEVARPVQIQEGLKMNMEIRIKDTEDQNKKVNMMNIKKMVNDMHESGKLTEIVKSSWSLSTNPIISNVFCESFKANPTGDTSVQMMGYNYRQAKSMSVGGSLDVPQGPGSPSPNQSPKQSPVAAPADLSPISEYGDLPPVALTTADFGEMAQSDVEDVEQKEIELHKRDTTEEANGLAEAYNGNNGNHNSLPIWTINDDEEIVGEDETDEGGGGRTQTLGYEEEVKSDIDIYANPAEDAHEDENINIDDISVKDEDEDEDEENDSNEQEQAAFAMKDYANVNVEDPDIENMDIYEYQYQETAGQ